MNSRSFTYLNEPRSCHLNVIIVNILLFVFPNFFMFPNDKSDTICNIVTDFLTKNILQTYFPANTYISTTSFLMAILPMDAA